MELFPPDDQGVHLEDEEGNKEKLYPSEPAWNPLIWETDADAVWALVFKLEKENQDIEHMKKTKAKFMEFKSKLGAEGQDLYLHWYNWISHGGKTLTDYVNEVHRIRAKRRKPE